MSRLAGLMLLIYGGVTVFYALTEVLGPENITKIAAYSTAGVGAVLFLLGLTHFRAPHKAFLASIPFLLYFHFEIYLILVYHLDDPKWIMQLALLALTAVLLYLSYRGYKEKLRVGQLARA